MNTLQPPPLGSTIRAARLGWGFAARHGCFIRMSDVSSSSTLIELCPVDKIPSGKGKGANDGYHRCWWETPELLGMIPWIRPIRKVHRYIAVVIDDDGNIIEMRTK